MIKSGCPYFHYINTLVLITLLIALNIALLIAQLNTVNSRAHCTEPSSSSNHFGTTNILRSCCNKDNESGPKSKIVKDDDSETVPLLIWTDSDSESKTERESKFQRGTPKVRITTFCWHYQK